MKLCTKKSSCCLLSATRYFNSLEQEEDEEIVFICRHENNKNTQPAKCLSLLSHSSFRFCTQRFCFLITCLVESSSLPSMSNPVAVTSRVGQQVALPCSWKPRLGTVAPPICHVQWSTHTEIIYEQKGSQKWQAAEFKDRTEISAERILIGDCSLTINDLQITDRGMYDSFMVINKTKSRKTRVFLQSIELSVLEHKSWKSHGLGEDMVLDLYTGHACKVIFQGRNSTEWSVLWMREDGNNQRLEKHPGEEQITLKKITSSDEGTFKVLDNHGLVVSTMQLSVNESASGQKHHQLPQTPAPVGEKTAFKLSYVLMILLEQRSRPCSWKSPACPPAAPGLVFPRS
ncbi:uncharacterized protein lgals17 [Thalassophryne amazonica]|uniref:uncharacterized protein lgals17 n=1 Tax=Thalassophryne amazonica TaxID=390379 RepID=UPI001471B952|nr:uncharacterized protein lgals17 [Thalassophryne amazonica]